MSLPQPKRKPLFDWDEARRMRADGMSYGQIAERMGVTRNAIARVCTQDAYDEHARLSFRRRDNYSEGKKCPGCARPIVNRATRCESCHHDAIVARARERIVNEEGWFWCAECGTHKPPSAFGKGNVRARNGKRSICRECETSRTRRYRQRWRGNS